MNLKSIVLFLSLIVTINRKSLAIRLFSNDDELIRSKKIDIDKDIEKSIIIDNVSSISSENIDKSIDHKIPYTEHEDSKDVTTKPKYIGPGEWAKPSKDKNISLEFVPKKIYAQVRGTHTIKRAPREDAIEEAETEEEKLNALRLREVVKNTKINTVYTEEGYEDSAYDHAGHIKDADFHEGFARKLKNRSKDKRLNDDIDSDEFKDYDNDYNDRYENNDTNSSDNYLESNMNLHPKTIVQNEIEILENNVDKNNEETVPDSSNSFDSKKLQKSMNLDKKLSNNKMSNIDNDNRDYRENLTRNDEIYNTNQTDRVLYETTNHPERFTTDLTNENLSTNDYGKVVWDFLKMDKYNQKETTTLSPNLELLTVMPFNLPISSYFTPKIEESVTVPTIYSIYQNNIPRGLDSEIINDGRITSISQNNDQIWPIQTDPVNYVELNDNPTIGSSIISNNDNSWKYMSLKIPDRSSLNEFVSRNKSIESKPILSDKNLTKNIDNDNDSFSNPIVNRKKPKYKVSTRHRPGKSTKTIKPYRSRKENVYENRKNRSKEYEKNLIDQRAKYMKVLNYVINDRDNKSKEFDDIILKKNSNEVKYFDFRIVDRPIVKNHADLSIVDQSTVPIESETITRDSKGKNFPRNRLSISSVDDFHDTSSILPIYNIDTFKFTDLSPPPLPSSSIRKNRNNEYRSIFPYEDKSYRDIVPIVKYFPTILNQSIKSRIKRSSLEYLKKIITNNGTTNRDKIFHVTKDRKNSRSVIGSRDIDSYDKIRNIRNIPKLRDDGDNNNNNNNNNKEKKTHEELLNYSPKISGTTIDKEIEERFNKNIDNNVSNKSINNNNQNDNRSNVEIEVPSFDYVEELADQKIEKLRSSVKTETNSYKYPFYNNQRIPDLSGLKYALDPKKVPRKTSTGMEFYDSRDNYKNCDEIDDDLKEIPSNNEKPSKNRDPSEQEPRLQGLGDKLDCFKAKYFDDNPFDNPLFIETNVGDPKLPKELLDSKKLIDRVLVLPIGTGREYLSQKLSKKPETDRNKFYSIINSKERKRLPKNEEKNNERISASLEILRIPYQKQVYEDVMNNIKESTNNYKNHKLTTNDNSTLTKSNVSKINIIPYDKILFNKTNSINIEMDSTTIIDGLLPPKLFNNYFKINNPRRNNRMIRKNRRRPPLYNLPRTIKRYHKITLQKRSLNVPINDLIIGESRNVIDKKSDGYLSTFKLRRKKKSFKNVTSSKDDPDNLESSRIVYTIKDRIKHSKPKDELKNIGKFTNYTTKFDEDYRRKEPRYEKIERKQNDYDSSMVSTILSTILSDDSNTDESTTITTIPNKKLRYSTLTRDRTKKDNKDEDSIEKKELIKKDNNNNYEVRENIDDVGTTPRILSNSLKYSDVGDYFVSDPSKYKGLFSTGITESTIVEETRSKEPKSEFEKNIKLKEDSNSEFEKNFKLMNTPNSEFEKNIKSKEEPNNEFEKNIKLKEDSNSEFEKNFKSMNTPNSEFEKNIKSKEEPYSEFEKNIKSMNTPNSEFEKNIKSKEDSNSEFEKNFKSMNTPNSEFEKNIKSKEDSNSEFEKNLKSMNTPNSEFEKNIKSSERNSEESDEDFSGRVKEREEDEEEEEEEEENENSKESKESDETKEEDDKKYFHYSSRPYSPSENYEDIKYIELGPRINKPTFYHPPFTIEKYEKSDFLSPFVENSEETSFDENKRKKTRYVSFPWNKKENEESKESLKKSKYYFNPIWNYEYPWDKRKRLAKEEIKRKKKYNNSNDFFSKDNNEDISSSEGRIYPWDYISYSNKNQNQNQNIYKRYYDDTDESGTDNKPIKYSSKYNLNNIESNRLIENNVNRINVPIDLNKFNKNNKTKNVKSLTNFGKILTDTSIPEDVTLIPKKVSEKRDKIDEKNLTKVTTINEKNSKNVRKKEILKERLEFTTTQSSINMETTIRSNRIDRFIDKSRRRRIIKNNNTNNEKDKKNFTKSKERVKRKKKILSITTTPRTKTITTVNPSFTKSIRRRPFVRSKISNNNNNNYKNNNDDNIFLKIKDIKPTQSTTTVEHRSRVSKESFIRTIYPDNDNSTIDTNNNNNKFDIIINDMDFNNRGNITTKNIESISMTTKETPDHVYRTKQIDKDGIKEMFVSIEPNNVKNISKLNDSDIDEFDENDNWRITKDFDLIGITSTESYLIGNLLGQTSEPYSRNDRELEDRNVKLKKIKEIDEKKKEEKEEEEEEKEKNNKIKSSIKFIHHPEQRLYYYVERRR